MENTKTNIDPAPASAPVPTGVTGVTALPPEETVTPNQLAETPQESSASKDSAFQKRKLKVARDMEKKDPIDVIVDAAFSGTAPSYE